ncbi:uncharacterized protein LOC143449441 isoform X2 [Clavelina lepadiformis]|uniref:uncharacterized protein LOC143449441 isoform X2 n=1 Tax=Clavelina lepadiformis TaxID=159417 RepID=UPI004041A228
MLSLPFYAASSLKTSWDNDDLIGRGRFATVRKCKHDKLGEIAVKCFCVQGSLEKQNETLKEIQREIDILYRLHHKNIVQIVGTTKWANCIGIIMECVDSGNLEDLLMSKHVAEIPWVPRMRFVYEIADALSYLHYYDETKSFVHGDLKPQNILLTSDLVVKIADFGSVNVAMVAGVGNVSVDIAVNTQHTPYYTAPEFLKNPLLKRTAKMDVYSLGMIGYEIITRNPVFHGVPFDLILQSIKDIGQKPEESYLRDIEASLESNPEDLNIFTTLKSIVIQCWDFNPENRPDVRQVRKLAIRTLRSSSRLQDGYCMDKLKHSTDVPPKTQISVKVNLEEFSVPFEKGLKPSPCYIQVDESKTDPVPDQDKTKQHIMLSYNWTDSKAVAHRIYDRLHNSGYSVWIDKEKMKGDIYSKMAQAVKNAYLILMFVSSNYEKSENCRREGSLAADRKKRIIPIKTQSDFEPDDWLSLIIAGKLYYNFGEGSFDEKFQELLKDIGPPLATTKTPSLPQVHYDVINDDAGTSTSQSLQQSPISKSSSMRNLSTVSIDMENLQKDDSAASNHLEVQHRDISAPLDNLSLGRNTISDRLKVTVVGDGTSKKTDLCHAIAANGHHEAMIPTVFDNHHVNILHNDEIYSLAIWDTAGQADYDRLRPLSYPETDVFLICFSVVEPSLLPQVSGKWVPEIQEHCPNTPFIVVGTEIDLRHNKDKLDELSKQDWEPLDRNLCRTVANTVGAFDYVECSAKTREGIDDLVYKIFAAAYGSSARKTRRKKACSIQ